MLIIGKRAITKRAMELNVSKQKKGDQAEDGKTAYVSCLVKISHKEVKVF